MAEASDRMQILYQNLKDAGCGQQMIQKCMALVQDNKKKELMLELSRYKKYLLTLVHDHQKEIDCLDYLVYTLNKQLV
ncbi:MAG: hypothetical protein Q4C60_08150 [Eubacteriales bacterium]|nr:hypothetical protein [Eubacteriales bacterium]